MREPVAPGSAEDAAERVRRLGGADAIVAAVASDPRALQWGRWPSRGDEPGAVFVILAIGTRAWVGLAGLVPLAIEARLRARRSSGISQ